jgi:hypothetical protein
MKHASLPDCVHLCARALTLSYFIREAANMPAIIPAVMTCPLTELIYLLRAGSHDRCGK